MLMDTNSSVSTYDFIVISFTSLKILEKIVNLNLFLERHHCGASVDLTWYSCKGVSAHFIFWSILHILFSLWINTNWILVYEKYFLIRSNQSQSSYSEIILHQNITSARHSALQRKIKMSMKMVHQKADPKKTDQEPDEGKYLMFHQNVAKTNMWRLGLLHSHLVFQNSWFHSLDCSDYSRRQSGQRGR